MWPNGFGPRRSLIETILGWLVALILLGAIVQALVEIIRPLVPVIGLGLLAVAGIAGWVYWRRCGW